MNRLTLLFTQHQSPNTATVDRTIAYFLAWSLPFLVLISRTTADLSLVVIDGLFLMRCFHQQQWQWLKLRWLQWYFIFVAYIIFINAPMSLNSADSFQYALFFLRWPIFAIALGCWLWQAPQHAKTFLISLMCCLGFLIADSWLQYFLGQDLLGHLIYPENRTIPPDRLTGPFNKPIVGIMLVRVLFIACFATLYFKRLKPANTHFFYTFSLLLVGILTIFISGERMAFILCLFGFTTLLVAYWFSFKEIRKCISLGLFASCIIITLAAIQMPNTTERTFANGWSKLIHFSTSDYGTVFAAAWRTWQDNIWIGSGLHTYKTHCELTGALSQTIFHCSHPHNLYLQLGTETGLIGLTLFSIMVMHLYSDLIKPHLRQRQWFIAALIFTVLNLGFWPLIGGISPLNNWVAALIWLGVGWCIAIKPPPLRSAL